MGESIDEDIREKKEELKEEARKHGLRENFGQEKVAELKQKHNYDKSLRYVEDSHEMILIEKIDKFDKWCRNFDLRDLK